MLGLAHFVLALPIALVRADGAYWGLGLVRWIVTGLRARPIVPRNRRKRLLGRVRHLVRSRLSYAKRAIIERCFAPPSAPLGSLPARPWAGRGC